MRILDYTILAAVAAAVYYALKSCHRTRRNGCACAGGCSGKCSTCGHQCNK